MHMANQDLNIAYAMNLSNKTDYFMPGKFKELKQKGSCKGSRMKAQKYHCSVTTHKSHISRFYLLRG